ncbi:hypothetical protein KKF34_11210 [Myxococcota bacterium]|nr:hypothetical protein [Myxococcota bacterium]MBU1382541.1 hypothetical protein [Myxococcota bacterium]MBU1497433.1 hypothetical protein [Myxococcota bacterium]
MKIGAISGNYTHKKLDSGLENSRVIKMDSIKPWGPMHTVVNKENLPSKITEMTSELLKSENEILKYMEKLKSGTDFSMKELFIMQELMFRNMRQLELITKLIQSASSTLKTLQQQGI